MQSDKPDDRQEQEPVPQRSPFPTGSTRFRSPDYAEQREHWPDEDDRR